jgi:hypothetical protein
MPSQLSRLATNLGLLLTAAAVSFSGSVIQLGYHMGHHGGIDMARRVCGLSYAGWSTTHKAAIVLLSVLVAVHVVHHWKWYTAVVRKRTYGKNKTATVLTILFVVTAVTGYIPWLVDWAAGSQAARKAFIEVHDKITWFLLVYFVLHAVQRFKWFLDALRRMRRPA